jgi:myo-inositol-1(or 4)-monophosphatase
MTLWAEWAAAAEEAARLGGAVLKERLEQVRTVDLKGEGRSNVVTDADRASETAVVAFLRARFPEHGVLAEESGAVAFGQTRWILDPLDGTTNYAHAVPHFCVSVAVETELSGATRVVAGVVFDPMRNELFTATLGEGARLNGKRLLASETRALSGALLCTGFPYDLQKNPHAPLGLFNRLVRQAQGIRRTGSAALDLAYVAAGRFDGFFEFGLKPWDIAAGGLLIEEAQGRIARIDGNPWSPQFGDVVAGCAGLFDELSTVCADFVQEIGWVPRAFG